MTIQTRREDWPSNESYNAFRELVYYVDKTKNNLEIAGLFPITTNTNGSYVRIGALQVCWQSTIELTFSTSSGLKATWTYPAEFSASPVVLPVTTAPTDTYTPSSTDISMAYLDSIPGDTSVGVIFRRNRGAVDFVAGDTATCCVFAIGPWQ